HQMQVRRGVHGAFLQRCSSLFLKSRRRTHRTNFAGRVLLFRLFQPLPSRRSRGHRLRVILLPFGSRTISLTGLRRSTSPAKQAASRKTSIELLHPCLPCWQLPLPPSHASWWQLT